MSIKQERTEGTELEVLFFGWLSNPGHHLRSHRTEPRFDSTPWGNRIDTGLSPQPEIVDGTIAEHHKDGWTAIAFWDRSGDRRPGSNSAFFVAREVTAEELIGMARKQWPNVFERRGFPELKIGAAT